MNWKTGKAKSARATWQDPKRTPKTYRLHPARLAELDAIADKAGLSNAAVIEALIQSEADKQAENPKRTVKRVGIA